MRIGHFLRGLVKVGGLMIGTEVIDGQIAHGTQAAHVADVTAPAAVTASAPAALTSAVITGGESPTEAEFNLLRADAVALRTTLAAAVVDITALRATNAALVTRINLINDDLEAFKIKATS